MTHPRTYNYKGYAITVYQEPRSLHDPLVSVSPLVWKSFVQGRLGQPIPVSQNAPRLVDAEFEAERLIDSW